MLTTGIFTTEDSEDHRGFFRNTLCDPLKTTEVFSVIPSVILCVLCGKFLLGFRYKGRGVIILEVVGFGIAKRPKK